MRKTLVISSLIGGGAERVMTILANAWVARGDAVTLITLDALGENAYPLDPRVARIGLGLLGPSSSPLQAGWSNLRRLLVLRRAIRDSRPAVVLSFVTKTNILTLLATAFASSPVVVSERVALSEDPPTGVWRLLGDLVYRRARIIVAQTERAADWIRDRYGVPVQVIPNPLAVSSGTAGDDAGQASLQRPAGDKLLLAVGRLTRQKGFDLLLAAFARVARDRPQWSLLILGEGPERASLEAQARALGLEGRVSLAGWHPDAQAVMRRCDAFVLSSRFEGLPNALLEAMANGLACVSFDCPAGPAEVIVDGQNGLLVRAEDVEALAQGLSRLMDSPALRESLGRAARAVRDATDTATVLAMWDQLFSDIVPEPRA